MTTGRKISLGMLGVFFTVAGINHFVNPGMYVKIIPDYLPAPEALNLISGAAEVAGGLGVFIPGLRKAAGWGLIALLIAVFPANIQMVFDGWPGGGVPAWVLWARLPLQGVFVWWVWRACGLGRGVGGRG